ncbi:MAG: hypothetical protein ACTSRZ_20665 [Promethearchaeota archaeon]
MNILGKQKLSKLFVGRHKLLRYLKQIFADISQSGAHDQAYCLLNAPGTQNLARLPRMVMRIQRTLTTKSAGFLYQ